MTLFSCSGSPTIDKNKFALAVDHTYEIVAQKLLSDDAQEILSLIREYVDAFDLSPIQENASISNFLTTTDGVSTIPLALNYITLKNALPLGEGNFRLKGSSENAILYFAPIDDAKSTLSDALLETDVLVNNISSLNSSGNGIQCFSIGARGQEASFAWTGYSFQILTGGIMKVCNQGDPSDYACQLTNLPKLKTGDRYHLAFHLNGDYAYIILFDYSRGSSYEQRCDISDLDVTQSGKYLYLHAWNCDVTFSNVNISTF